MRPNKKPTRRKPDRGFKQGQFSTVPDYKPPFYVALYGFLLGAAILGVPALLACMHMAGWY